MREAEGNVAFRITETADKDAFEVAGRGELQIGVLLETMRREGFELSISRPRVIYRNDPATGQRLDPIEQVQVAVAPESTCLVVGRMGLRTAALSDMRPSGGGSPPCPTLTPARALLATPITDDRGGGTR